MEPSPADILCRSQQPFRVADEVRRRKNKPQRTQRTQRTQRNNWGRACGGSLQKSFERGKPLEQLVRGRLRPPKPLRPAHALRRSRKPFRGADVSPQQKKSLTAKPSSRSPGTGYIQGAFSANAIRYFTLRTKRNYALFDIVPGAYAPRLANRLSFFADSLRISAAPREFFLRRLRQSRSSGAEGKTPVRGSSIIPRCFFQ